MTLAHVMGIPVEESVLQLAPTAVAIATVLGITARAKLGRLRRRRPAGQILPSARPPGPTCNPKTTHEEGPR